MARKLPPLGEALVREIEEAWSQPQEDWARKRLLVVRLIAQHELTTEQIAKVAGVSRKTVFNYRDSVCRGGVPALLTREWAGGPTPTVRGAVAEEFVQRLEAGKFRQVRDAQAWIKEAYPQDPQRERRADMWPQKYDFIFCRCIRDFLEKNTSFLKKTFWKRGIFCKLKRSLFVFRYNQLHQRRFSISLHLLLQRFRNQNALQKS